jgi:hypothetical protein
MSREKDPGVFSTLIGLYGLTASCRRRQQFETRAKLERRRVPGRGFQRRRRAKPHPTTRGPGSGALSLSGGRGTGGGGGARRSVGLRAVRPHQDGRGDRQVQGPVGRRGVGWKSVLGFALRGP